MAKTEAEKATISIEGNWDYTALITLSDGSKIKVSWPEGDITDASDFSYGRGKTWEYFPANRIKEL